MGFIFGLVKCFIKLSLLFLIFAAVIVIIPNLPPYSKYTAVEIEPYQPRVGPLAPNGDLNNVEELYKGKVLGPEAFQIYKGDVYTGVATGEIVKLSPGGQVTFVTHIGQPCTSLTKAHICGRPLGFQIDEKNGQMYVADAYYGIWRVDLKTNKKQLLVSPRVEIEGRKPKIFNNLALAKNGDIYWTDSSSEFHLTDAAYSSLTDPTGRLFYYNAAKNESKVLLDDLWLANGVALSPDQQFIVVSESLRLRLIKYYIDGPKKGKSEVFISGLPGVPDNLRELPDGSGLIAALYSVEGEHHPLIVKSLSQTPLARKFLARIQRLIEIPFEFLNSQFPNVIFEEIVHHIGHFKSLSPFMPGLSGIVVIDWNGKIITSYYNNDGTQREISDVIVYNDKLYIGSPNEQDYIGVVPAPEILKKAFTNVKASPSPKTAETVTKEAPKAKMEAKPVETPKAQETRKVEQKKEDIKNVKPVEREPPKPAQPPKQSEPVKTTTSKPVTQKPVAPKPAAAKPQEPVKKTESEPLPPKSEAKPSKVEQEKSTTSKQNEHKTPPPKIETKPAPSPKPEIKTKSDKPADKSEIKQEPKTKKVVKESSQKPITEKSSSKPVPEQIPIKEEIPSDTVKPNKDTLKVIKKGGPTEIPNPNL